MDRKALDEKEKNMKDMTNGSPSKILWTFSLPLLLSIMFQQLYNIVDSVVAGKFIGVNALAAVGASYPITMIFMAVASGANIGCSVIISQYFGAKKYKKMKTAIFTAIISIAVVSLLLTVIGFILCNSLMRLLQTPTNIFADSALYLRIYILGLMFLFIYNICTGIFTALGDSSTPLYFLIASSIGNIVFDLIFVIVFKMGVAGVAWATFMCQGVASVLALLTLLKRIGLIETDSTYSYFSFRMLKKISTIAIPSILQQSFISVGNLFIQALVNGYGSNVIAAYSAAIKLNTFAITSFTTMANGLSSFTAQNMGAKKINRVYKGYHAGIAMIMIVCIPFLITFFFFSDAIMKIFLSNTEDITGVLKEGRNFLRIVSPFYIVVSLKLMTDGVLRGAGAMKPFMIATLTDLIIRVILSFVLSAVIQSPSGIWLSWPLGWVAGTLLSLLFYWKGDWKNKDVIGNNLG